LQTVSLAESTFLDPSTTSYFKLVSSWHNESDTMKKHITKDEWVAMYEEMGWDGEKRMQWHRLFEARHPEAHQGFME
jgi:hypothetical protein